MLQDSGCKIKLNIKIMSEKKFILYWRGDTWDIPELYFISICSEKKLNNLVMGEVENMIKFSKDFTKFLIKYNFIPFIGILAFKNIF